MLIAGKNSALIDSRAGEFGRYGRPESLSVLFLPFRELAP